ncbi:MAG: hypothetical protein QM788_12785 [Roseateles sp.]|uniref:hypothetical protein n=1 Tax=Roseateles sp. TaxID=1971397 RepID=UPI0039E94C2A
MALLRLLLRVVILLAGAAIGLALFLFAVIAFVGLLLYGLVTGRKPAVQFRMNRNPWAPRRPPADETGEVVDIEVREVPDAPPLPLPHSGPDAPR